MQKKTKRFPALWVLVMACGLGLLLAAAGMAGGEPLFRSADPADKPLRLHVLANSDSPFDQRLKLELRDQVIGLLSREMDRAADKQEAMARLADRLPEVETACNRFLADRCDYRAQVFLQRDDFPQSDYDGLTFAAGEYDALRIVLGDGAGHNWWCVLFPPLCFLDLAGEYSDQEAVAVLAQYPEYQPQSGLRIGWRLGKLFSCGKEQTETAPPDGDR